MRSRVFLSHSSQDRSFAIRLARELVVGGAEIWLDKWEIKVGDSIQGKLEEGILGSSYLAILLSKASVASDWVRLELRAAMTRELAEQRVVVLPVLVEDCEVPLFLRDKHYADFRDDFDAGLGALRRSIQPPDLGHHGRLGVDGYFNDFTLDHEFSDGRMNYSIVIQSHGGGFPYSVNCQIEAETNDVMGSRMEALGEAGFGWACATLGLHSIADLAEKLNDGKVFIDDDKVAEVKGTITDPRTGWGLDLVLKARRIGPNPDNDIMYEWASIARHIADQQQAAVNKAVSPMEMARYVSWIKANPASKHRI